MDKIDKESLEKLLGYEINNFSIHPQFEDNVLYGFNIEVEKNQSLEKFEHTVTITPTGIENK